MEESLGKLEFDATWCRWVGIICFVAAIFHEYIDYRTRRLAPRRPAVESFVDEVMASWRATGANLMLP